MSDLHTRAGQYLRQALDADTAAFREGQWEAVRVLVEDRARLLMVQRTGWGKSMVYFLTTRLLRDDGAGPTLLVSPLLALMRNQIAAAERIGLRAVTINSTNTEQWEAVEARLLRDEADILLVSPERLGNAAFRQHVLARIAGRVGLFVVDEAHCISDWGHDFRPDYRRIVRILQALPPNVPVLATTATANDRVVRDVAQQMGEDLLILRGGLARTSLLLQATRLPHQAKRMAWLAAHLPDLPGSGIIYVRTVKDADRLAGWLRTCGIEAPAYYGAAADREEHEQQLLDNRVKALVGTSALGMGFDKPDLGFVIHYQRPGSVVAYYQQVGRAGRNGADAYGILLSGTEDDDITDYFIRTAFPPAAHIRAVLHALEEADEGLRLRGLKRNINLRHGQIQKVLKVLDVHAPSPVVKRDGRWYRTANPYEPDLLRIRQLTAIRRAEQEELHRYMEGRRCLMAYLREALDDEDVRPCGRCAVCVGRPLIPETAPHALHHSAARLLKRSYQPITPRKQTPDRKAIPEHLRLEEGRVLCTYGDAGWGALVKRGKYRDHRFADELVRALSEMIRQHWRPEPPPRWMTCVPSLRRPELVPSFAQRLARRLEVPFVEAITKKRETAEQKEQQNSFYRRENLRDAFDVQIPAPYHNQDVFLVDDMIDSRWTMTVLGAHLRSRGAGSVYPVGLAMTTSR